jgi:multidrug transporter EmrE-like cation transporter
MLLPPFVVAIVLLSALLHATWNVAVRAGTDRRRETVLVVAGGGVLGIILVPFVPLPSMASWPYLLASAVLNTIYFCLIAEAYERGELSLAYPLMRGTAPMMAALAAWALIGEVLPAQAWFGIAAICGGIVLLARRHGTSERSTVRLALANAVIIAAYTLNDAIGARVSGSALAYTLWLFPIMAVPAILALHGWRLPQTPTWREARRGIGSAGCVIDARDGHPVRGNVCAAIAERAARCAGMERRADDRRRRRYPEVQLSSRSALCVGVERAGNLCPCPQVLQAPPRAALVVYFGPVKDPGTLVVAVTKHRCLSAVVIGGIRLGRP